MTLPFPAHSMQPESSDGFASVGTILPEERAALLPGGSFRFAPAVRPTARYSLARSVMRPEAFAPRKMIGAELHELDRVKQHD